MGGGPVWDSNVFSKSFTYQPTLSKFKGGPVKKNTLYFSLANQNSLSKIFVSDRSKDRCQAGIARMPPAKFRGKSEDKTSPSLQWKATSHLHLLWHHNAVWYRSKYLSSASRGKILNSLHIRYVPRTIISGVPSKSRFRTWPPASASSISSQKDEVESNH